jgi:hypothetical protein
MAHETKNGISDKDGAFHHDFNLFPQAKEDSWTEVHKRKQDGKGSKEKFIETVKNGKEKQKSRNFEINMLNDKDDKEDSIPVKNMTVQEQIRIVGEKDTGTMTPKTSTIRLEFNIGLYVEKIEERDSLLRVLHKLALVDTTVYVKSYFSEEVWKDDRSFPSGEKFEKEFRMRKEVSNSGYITMYVYATIVHHKEWKDIKYSEMVLNHLKKNYVFAYVNEYEAKKVGSPGCI